jgi:hypothetical protein
MSRLVGDTLEFTLTLTLATDDGPFAIDPTIGPIAKLRNEAGVLVTTFPASLITRVEKGVYTLAWVPTVAGPYTLTWEFEVDTVPLTEVEYFLVFAEESDVPVLDPDVPLDNICMVSGRFLDAGGRYKRGVYVRFSPDTVSSENTPVGWVAADATAVSGSDGMVSLPLLRNVTGILSISGIGMVRRVTVPDTEAVDIFALLSTADDLLVVQQALPTELIRSS